LSPGRTTNHPNILNIGGNRKGKIKEGGSGTAEGGVDLDHQILVNILLLDAKATGPLVQGDVLVVVQVTGLKEAGGAVLHGDEWRTQRGQLRVGQVPINGVLVQLAKLPVHGEDVHVVILLEVPGQQLHGVVSGLQALLVLMDLLHSQLLLLGQKVVVLVPFIQSDQDVLEPVPHAQGEFSQLGVQAGGDVFARPNVVQVEFVALLGALQGALGGKEVAGRVEGLVVIAAYLLKLANGGRAAGRVLAHAHGSVVLIQFTHFAMFAVVVLAGIFSHHLLFSFLSTFIKFSYFHLHGVGSHRSLCHLSHGFLYHLCLIRQGFLLLRGCQGLPGQAKEKEDPGPHGAGNPVSGQRLTVE